jgi:hypothetical protein
MAVLESASRLVPVRADDVYSAAGIKPPKEGEQSVFSGGKELEDAFTFPGEVSDSDTPNMQPAGVGTANGQPRTPIGKPTREEQDED